MKNPLVGFMWLLLALGTTTRRPLAVAEHCYARLGVMLASGCTSAAYAPVRFEICVYHSLGAVEQYGGRFSY